jgi:predicted naringenin-chalcone synthase
MTTAHINRISTAVPPHDVHAAFVEHAASVFADRTQAALFRRMARKSGIEHRYSCLPPSELGEAGADTFYRRGQPTSTAERMRRFELHAPRLAEKAVRSLLRHEDASRVTHLVITCCTGFSAPGLDIELIRRCGLSPSIERTIVGFMGCYAAMNALKLARHIVRSEPRARVLVLNLELCTLHLQESQSLEQMLCFLQFGDGCAASLVSAEPRGIALNRFASVMVPGTQDLITWHVRDCGFEMILSGKVPAVIQTALRANAAEILDGAPAPATDLWAVHPGGRSVLDAVERAFDLAPAALDVSRDVLRRYGNMSSATVMFVLQRMLEQANRAANGCAMAFGPGLVAETLLFNTVGRSPAWAPVRDLSAVLQDA